MAWFRVRFWRRYYQVPIHSGRTLSVDLWNRNWRLFRQRRSWEQALETLWPSLVEPGDVVIDVGAQVGMFTGPVASTLGMWGSILSFEPDPENRAVLASLVARNQLTNVRLFACGLSDTQRSLVFHRPAGAWGSFMRGQARQILDSGFPDSYITEFEAPCFRLDDVVSRCHIGRIDLIKVDVDGPEVAVLKGAVETLSRYQPFLIVEASRFYADHGYTLDDLFEAVRGVGYEMYYAKRDSAAYVRCDGPASIDVDISRRGQSIDLFGIPQSRTDPRARRLRSMWSDSPE